MERPGTVDAKRFSQGLTYEQYVASIESNLEDFQRNYNQVTLSSEDHEFFSRLGARMGTKINFLALVEDWCPDVVRGLPVAAKIAEACPDMELRVFPRDENLDVMDQYLYQGKYRSIPTFVFLDEKFNEIARWVERPASANTALREVQEMLGQQNLSEEQARKIRRQKLDEIYTSRIVPDTIRDIREVLSKHER